MESALSPLAIRLQSCAKTFPDGTRALEPVDLAIEAGETLVFLGPSGCGKTTTLRLIAGLEMPDPGGRVLFDGEDVTRLPIERRQVGMVFQSYALFPHMNVAQNVGYGLKVAGRPDAERRKRVAEMLEMMRIDALAEREIGQLSGGQRQRVALARALAVRPRALLLDEPLTALDAKLRDSLRLEIDLLLRKFGITAIYVTHDQAEAMALGDRIVVMEHGRVAQVGRPRDIYHNPANAFVAEFIGTMNRLDGAVEGDLFRCRAGSLPWPGSQPGPRTAMFRPEDATLLEEPGGLAGHVAAAFFLGDRVRLFVEAEGCAQPLVVECPPRRAYVHGDPVHIDVSAEHLMSFA